MGSPGRRGGLATGANGAAEQGESRQGSGSCWDGRSSEELAIPLRGRGGVSSSIPASSDEIGLRACAERVSERWRVSVCAQLVRGWPLFIGRRERAERWFGRRRERGSSGLASWPGTGDGAGRRGGPLRRDGAARRGQVLPGTCGASGVQWRMATARAAAAGREGARDLVCGVAGVEERLVAQAGGAGWLLATGWSATSWACTATAAHAAPVYQIHKEPN